jgi:hypothetical protein
LDVGATWVNQGVFAFAVLLAQTTIDAPADRYFGRLQMSSLRVRYETMQLKKRYETHELLPEETEHLLVLTQDSFDSWRRAYPEDAWLPSTGYEIAQLYAELPGGTARTRAVTLYVYVKSQFPKTKYAAESRDALHRGVSVKPDPAWAREKRAAMHTPAPSPSPVPTQTPASAPTPSSTSSPAGATPSPKGSPPAYR